MFPERIETAVNFLLKCKPRSVGAKKSKLQRSESKSDFYTQFWYIWWDTKFYRPSWENLQWYRSETSPRSEAEIAVSDFKRLALEIIKYSTL